MSKSQRILLTAGLLVAASAYVYDRFVEDRVFPKRFGVVEPGLIFRSGQLHPALIERTLTDNGIDVVLDMTHPRAGAHAEQDAEARTTKALGIARYRYPLGGNGTGHVESYVAAVTQLHASVQEGDAVLVHCSAGSQRTGGVIALYRVLLQGWSPEAAVEEMTVYDWKPGKDRVLLEYLDDNLPYITARLVELGVLEEAPDPLPRYAGALG